MSKFEPSHAFPGQRQEPDHEPVCFGKLIQPYGVLLALSDPELILLQVSTNTQDYFGISPADLLGQPLGVLLDPASVDAIRQAVDCNGPAGQASLRICRHSGHFNGTVYRTTAGVILELEPEPASATLGPWPTHPQVKQAMAQLRQIADLEEFLHRTTATVRRITGFDRVMIYRFDAAGAGAVVAEAKRADLSSYLELHYPASDIPEPVRALYRQGLVRYIPDLRAQAVAIVPAAHPVTGQPLDLSLSTLRSVDPCCVEYHQNMEVAALLVIALVQKDRLWGLISCHHQTPKFVPCAVRESCELLGQLIASELANKVNTAELGYWRKLRSLQSEFLQSIAQAKDLRQALVNPAPRLLDLVSAQGAAVCLEDAITLAGATPTLEQVRALLKWVETQLPDSSPPDSLTSALPDYPLFHTHALSQFYPEAAAFQDSASGLLVLQISRIRRYTLLWFRPEVLQTIHWAGDPSPALQMAADGRMVLCPRQSFERWQEVVRSTALPWQACELESALDLRSAIVGIVMKQADELARINQELERSNQELDSFVYAASHDLKEPLRGIHNYSNLLLKGYSNVLDEAGQSRLQTLIRLTRRMEALINALLKFSRLGQAELHLEPIDLTQSVHQVLADLQTSRPDLPTEIRIPRPLPTVNGDPILIHDVLSNLISNAIKYNDKPEQWIEIGYIPPPDDQEDHPTAGRPIDAMGETAQADGPLHQHRSVPNSSNYVFFIRDNGIGIRERHFDSIFRLFKRLHEQHLYGGGTGVGLTIAKKIIERHGGHIWVESIYGEGSTFYFSLS